MAKQRMINTRIWNDSWFRSINPLDRYLFLYFLSNSHTNICGIYELPIDTIAYETGIDFRDIEKSMLPKLEPKIYYIDSYVIIINFIKYQNYNSPKIKSGIMAEFNQIPIEIQEKAILYGYKTLEMSNGEFQEKISRRQSVYIRDRGICFYCNKEIKEDIDVEIDHIIPLSRGGSDNYSNLILSCRKCNQKKLDKTSMEFCGKNIEGRKYHMEQALKELKADQELQSRVRYIYPTLKIESTISHSNSNSNSNLNSNSKKNTASSNDDAKQQNNSSVKKRSESQQVVDYWIEKWEKTFNTKRLSVKWDIYVKNTNPIVKQLGVDRMKQLLDLWFIDDEWGKKCKWEYGAFIEGSNINKLNTQL